jgi:hypothetical protein
LWLSVILPWQERRRLAELSEACTAANAVPQPAKRRAQG